MTDAPQFGARFRFDRISVDGDTARYRLQLLLPEQAVFYEIALGGDLEIEPQETGREPDDSADVPQWARKHLLSLARQIARAARSGEWPRKLVRWHEG